MATGKKKTGKEAPPAKRTSKKAEEVSAPEVKPPAKAASKKGDQAAATAPKAGAQSAGRAATAKGPAKEEAKAPPAAKAAKSAEAKAPAVERPPKAPAAGPVQSAPQHVSEPVPQPQQASPSAPHAAPQSAGAASSLAASTDGEVLPARRGKIGVFGGPKDRGIKPDDKLGLPTGKHFTYERVRSLDPKSFYCAMRWDYHALGKTPEEGRRWWANKRLLISNPVSGVAVVARAVDYGPHQNSGLDIAVSPAAAEALGVEIGDEVQVDLADPGSPLGLVK